MTSSSCFKYVDDRFEFHRRSTKTIQRKTSKDNDGKKKNDKIMFECFYTYWDKICLIKALF